MKSYGFHKIKVYLDGECHELDYKSIRYKSDPLSHGNHLDGKLHVFRYNDIEFEARSFDLGLEMAKKAIRNTVG
jgi:hypothetical protein